MHCWVKHECATMSNCMTEQTQYMKCTHCYGILWYCIFTHSRTMFCACARLSIYSLSLISFLLILNEHPLFSVFVCVCMCVLLYSSFLLEDIAIHTCPYLSFHPLLCCICLGLFVCISRLLSSWLVVIYIRCVGFFFLLVACCH